MAMKLEKLVSSIENLVDECERVQSEHNIHKEEIFYNVTEFIKYIYKIANITDLEQRAIALATIDQEALLRAITIIDEQRNTAKYNEKINPQEIINRLKNRINFNNDKKSKNEYEIAFEVALSWDHQFLELMTGYDASSEVFDSLISLLVKKLDLIPSNEMWILWGRLRDAYGTAISQKNFPHYEIIPNDFFAEPVSIAEAKNKYAKFIAKYKPLIANEAVKNSMLIPNGEIAGIAQILAITKDSYSEPFSNIENLLRNLITSIILILKKTTWRSDEHISRATGADLFVHGDIGLIDHKNYLRSLLSNMKRLIAYIDIYVVDKKSEIEEHLWLYKLSREISEWSPKAKIKKTSSEPKKKVKSELEWQKDLSVFLIERGILSYGRKFGRAEIDLYIDHFNVPVFIEVKVYKKPISRTKAAENIAQIFHYSDQLKNDVEETIDYMDNTSAVRGILLCFNYSDTIIKAPRQSIRDRLWVLPINLGCEPSKAKNAIEVEESSNPNELISLIKIKAD